MVREAEGVWAEYWMNVKNLRLEIRVKAWRSNDKRFFFDVSGVLFAPDADFAECCKAAADALADRARKPTS